MHELSVTENILTIVLKEAEKVQAARVIRIEMTIGKLSGIVPDCVQFAFDVISRGTIAEKADLAFHQPPCEIRCRSCQITYPAEGADDVRCPRCGDMQIEILNGRELTVDRIELE